MGHEALKDPTQNNFRVLPAPPAGKETFDAGAPRAARVRSLAPEYRNTVRPSNCFGCGSSNPTGLPCGSFGFSLTQQVAVISIANPTGLPCGSFGFTLKRSGQRDTGKLRQGIR